jgi:ubiquinone/menaquinone biosynthesis C-methylase UbiE
MRLRKLLLLAAAATLAAALWWRRNPSACPYGQKFWVEAPHPIITPERLREVLDPGPGERVLEIGPGTGYYTLDMAEWVGPEGTVEIFDIQQEFLDHTTGRAEQRGLDNVVATQGDATDLPFEEDSIDAVVLTAVLGEIPDRAAALREIARVLRPGGRLVVGELFGDPHFTTFKSLCGQCGDAALRLERRSGNWFGYFARFAAPAPAEAQATAETTRRT